MLVADGEQLDAFDQLATIDAPGPGARGGAERATVDHHRRGQDLIAAGQAPIERQALAQSAPQAKPGPTGEAGVQRGEGNAREPAGDAPLHAAEGQHPDHPDQPPTQAQVRLAPAAVHADPLPIHSLEFGLDREDEHLHIGQDVPAITAVGPGNTADRRWRQITGAQHTGVRHRPDMVRPGRRTVQCAGSELTYPLISRSDSKGEARYSLYMTPSI